VLAVSQFGAGPFGTQLLADLGADIIKIEDPAWAATSARAGGAVRRRRRLALLSVVQSRQASLTLDLKHPAGQAVLHDLVRVSHAVYNNLRGDLPAKLGLTYEALRAVNPAWCAARSPASAPPAARGRAGLRLPDPGLRRLDVGHRRARRPAGEVRRLRGGLRRRLRLDGALLAGLWDAQRSGVGRDIDISLLDTAVSMLSYFAIWTLNRDWQPDRDRRLRPPVAGPGAELPHRRRLDRRLLQQAKFWEALVDVLELPELARDPRFRHLPRSSRPQGRAGADPQGALRRAHHRGLARRLRGACRALR
jgi:crotonobetainyl-CoA:carnitine CoA-transferase CaiB-like acyl-CoA transferase